MIILGIETSCDETAASVVADGRKILSNVVASSQKLHEKTGGIVPETAAREQIKYIIPVIKEALENVESKREIVEAIAVTVGPGLIGSLLVGVETAKTLSFVLNKPLVPVNHLVGHIYADFLENSSPVSKIPEFPAIALIASGGSTELVLMKNHGKYLSLGQTRDDAAGETFDKIARILELGYPGGPAVARASKFKVKNSKLKIKLPRPMINTDDFDFSFSGLKTAVFYKVNSLKKDGRLNPAIIQALAFETQEAITDVLVKKTIGAAEKYKAKSLLLSGGVAANERLREKIKNERGARNLKTDFYVPPAFLCTDNAAFVASSAFFNFKPVPWPKVKALPSLEIGL